ncbi:hypothetical protein QCA50_010293 [Cerrena zonata]|uniref:Anaphase-promoting complex subunit 4-like WD40 domain-containing protein n=1 Tax=Cerrena zonata TaxID=2478898 RepID=A0AAW0FYV1_9APHY
MVPKISSSHTPPDSYIHSAGAFKHLPLPVPRVVQTPSVDEGPSIQPGAHSRIRNQSSTKKTSRGSREKGNPSRPPISLHPLTALPESGRTSECDFWNPNASDGSPTRVPSSLVSRIPPARGVHTAPQSSSSTPGSNTALSSYDPVPFNLNPPHRRRDHRFGSTDLTTPRASNRGTRQPHTPTPAALSEVMGEDPPVSDSQSEDESEFEAESESEVASESAVASESEVESESESESLPGPGSDIDSDSELDTAADPLTTTPVGSPPRAPRTRPSIVSSREPNFSPASLSKQLRFMKKDGQFITYSYTTHMAIDMPPELAELELGTLFVRLNPDTLDVAQVWTWTSRNVWVVCQDGDAHPIFSHRCLSIRSIAGRTEANWVLKTTYKTYRQRELRQQLLAQYSCTNILQDFTDSITCLEFSPDGKFLAVGTADATLAIIEIQSMKSQRCFKRHSAVTALLWYGSEIPGPLLIIGFHDGTVELLKGLARISVVEDSASFVGPVAHLAYSESPEYGEYLAVSAREDVIILKNQDTGYWKTFLTMPRPEGKLDRPVEPRAVYWARAGHTIVVCYLNHGFISYNLSDPCSPNWVLPIDRRIAYSDFSKKTGRIAFSNLYDGFTVYELTPYDFEYWNIQRKNDNNVPLPVCFIHNDEDILMGSPFGQVCITSAGDTTGGRHTLYNLHHKSLPVQSLAYQETPTGSMIATGTFSGLGSTVWIWQSPSGQSAQNIKLNKSSGQDMEDTTPVPADSTKPRSTRFPNNRLRENMRAPAVQYSMSKIVLVGAVLCILCLYLFYTLPHYPSSLSRISPSSLDAGSHVKRNLIRMMSAVFNDFYRQWSGSKLMLKPRLYLRAGKLFINKLGDWWKVFWTLVDEIEEDY